MLQSKGEVVHLLPVYYRSLVDGWSSAEAGGGMGRPVSRIRQMNNNEPIIEQTMTAASWPELSGS